MSQSPFNCKCIHVSPDTLAIEPDETTIWSNEERQAVMDALKVRPRNLAQEWVVLPKDPMIYKCEWVLGERDDCPALAQQEHDALRNRDFRRLEGIREQIQKLEGLRGE